ncbi:unnamed protein product [Bursaphelenchus okinawaensis]|uniref:Uncharacterized protein n=1 Tax=Bursaphelenchus okinawaensis TaxID=465554 RepID=A0A811LT11_9BILA|nr:unnamed protein product [Bursaphelenchus okinawaensis]CAG9128018.1 unnamed protein product [Bursaphelenchus okinawaensis]
MNTIFKFCPDIWFRVKEHLSIMEDICSLATVNKYFYKMVHMDFKQLCYDHVVYRTEGETWAYAFSEWKVGSRVHVINENDSVFIVGERSGMYSIKQEKFVFSSPHRWCILNSNVLFLPRTSCFLVYKKQSDRWETIEADPTLKLTSYCTYCLGPLPNYRVMLSMLSDRNDVYKRVLLTFKKDCIKVKTFDAKEKLINTYHLYNDVKKGNHQITQLMKMPFPVEEKQLIDFCKWFKQLHISTPKVRFIDVKTGAEEYLNFQNEKNCYPTSYIKNLPYK